MLLFVSLEIAIQNKADRLKKRLDDIEMAKSVKDVKRQEEDKRKQEALYEHRQEASPNNRYRVYNALLNHNS